MHSLDQTPHLLLSSRQEIPLQVDAQSAIPHGGIHNHRQHSIPNITKNERSGGNIYIFIYWYISVFVYCVNVL